MSENSYSRLDLHKCDCHHANNPLDWCRSTRLREQLIAEIHALEEQLAGLEEREETFDFSLRQTCREMIHSRQQLYLQLRR